MAEFQEQYFEYPTQVGIILTLLRDYSRERLQPYFAIPAWHLQDICLELGQSSLYFIVPRYSMHAYRYTLPLVHPHQWRIESQLL